MKSEQSIETKSGMSSSFDKGVCNRVPISFYMQEAKTCKLLSYASWVAHLAEKPPQPLLSGVMGFSDIVPPDFSPMVAYSELYIWWNDTYIKSHI